MITPRSAARILNADVDVITVGAPFIDTQTGLWMVWQGGIWCRPATPQEIEAHHCWTEPPRSRLGHAIQKLGRQSWQRRSA